MSTVERPISEILSYTAACPECGQDVLWHAAVSLSGDLAQTDLAYRIDCPSCAAAAEPTVLRARPRHVPVSQLGWLGRSA